jgi:hypothetical protein
MGQIVRPETSATIYLPYVTSQKSSSSIRCRVNPQIIAKRNKLEIAELILFIVGKNMGSPSVLARRRI